MNRAIVIFSGGPDSTAATLWALKNNYNPELVTFRFSNENQHEELESADKVAKTLGLPHAILDFTSPLKSFSPQSRALMHIGIPKGEQGDDKPHLLTFGAGMVLSTIACYALYNKVDTVIWGATKDDSYLNDDYTEDFAAGIARLVQASGKRNFQILTPFFQLHKYEVLAVYKEQEALFSQTMSCLFPIDQKHCGICKACISRRVAARLARVEDRTAYFTENFTSPIVEEKMENPENLSDMDFRQIIQSGSVVGI